jgi:hypothetical protein
VICHILILPQADDDVCLIVAMGMMSRRAGRLKGKVVPEI